ncbi:DUF29 domain-containing protein [Nostoc sp. FACHB-152]|uniref:DUF29 domain-containing protein n=1 Tax=unclassified Nostoc TaxID=2593658 RepID=UPI001689E8C7|nr:MULTISPECIES: DUF29 domain-containing protein [unclassified Nostoc]MBD2449831.1 DUF29 domain-containing protein [Nostoc sp. FACHB-152]MBD2471590.1 DUF29 domain-containing protein [Nostoc sp. FACHB-145]
MTAPQSKVFTNLRLYDQDFYLWIETTAKQLKEGRFSDVDLENLIEEIESMGRSEKRVLESNLVVLLMHLLKYKYQPEKRSNSWKVTIREHRRRLTRTFKDSPSLKPYFQEVFTDCYQDARKQASDETGLSVDIFPVESPFTMDECLDEDFLPD